MYIHYVYINKLNSAVNRFWNLEYLLSIDCINIYVLYKVQVQYMYYYATHHQNIFSNLRTKKYQLLYDSQPLEIECTLLSV